MSDSTREQNLAVIDELASHVYDKCPPRQADLVMKGGITSGVVYPLAVCELAKTYRFRNVGGSSAGGIAAALAAAAEHARDTGGFQRLAGMPTAIGNDLPKLFQPSRGTRPLFEVFRALQDRRRGGLARAARLLWYVLSRQSRGSLLGAAVFTLCGLWSVMLAAGAPHDPGDWGRLALRLVPLLPVILVGAVLGALAGTARAANRELPRNGHGLCIGSRGGKAGTGVAPFTDWMHEQLQYVAGAPGGVLTFGDLWGTAANNDYDSADRSTKEKRDDALRELDPLVRLEMMTTIVTQRRPIRLPFTEKWFYFCPVELRRWFPEAVFAHLCSEGEPLARSDGTPVCCPEHPGEQLRTLPDAHRMPVLMAVRMTLSFPGLISAVPLWTVYYGDPAGPLVRCWFSDGGISSNFPIHFFDTLLPSRPTFAISLGPYPGPPHHTQDVYYPGPGTVRAPVIRASDQFGQFLGGILDTMQNWSDAGQSRLPGYRDRIVEVRQRPHEGGMNLDMDEDTILALAARGHAAAVKLLAGFDFDKHREARYRTAVSGLQQVITKMGEFYDQDLPSLDASYRAFINGLKPDGVARVDQLLTFVGRAEAGSYPYPPPDPDLTDKAPRPEPDLRIVARY